VALLRVLLRFGAFFARGSSAVKSVCRARFAGRVAVLEVAALAGSGSPSTFVVSSTVVCTVGLVGVGSSLVLGPVGSGTLAEGVSCSGLVVLFCAGGTKSGEYAGGGVPPRTCVYPGRVSWLKTGSKGPPCA
jgi:hypothetical protein